MKTRRFPIFLLYILLFVYGSGFSAQVFAINEKVITLGGGASWNFTDTRLNIAEVQSIRPFPVLVLSSATTSTIGYNAATGVLGLTAALTQTALDASLSFDESDTKLYKDSANRYKILVPHEVEPVDRRYARAGTGAALFNGQAGITVRPQKMTALFAPGNRIGDFTIEFWLYPLNLENGEQILSWSASAQNANIQNDTMQRISCTASKNKLNWVFTNFFMSSDQKQTVNLNFSGSTAVVPKTWSHHLVRFDAVTGMVEYIVNGEQQAIVYATSTGSERIGRGGEVFTPVAGANGSFIIGERFTGLIDEFKIHSFCVGRNSVQKYSPAGGRVETRAIDLGEYNSGILRVDATGGRINIKANQTNNSYKENGRFRFSDNTEMNFFIRSSENPYLLMSSKWIPFIPGEDISNLSGRYVQLAVDFYPSADGESSPYLDSLSIVYLPGEPPLPPANVTAVAADGAVLLRWKPSPDAKTGGYLVYYSEIRGELFGVDSVLGPSPVDVGNRTSINIEGLKNGTLYYFRIAAYDNLSGNGIYNAGEFSAEVRARPLAGLHINNDVITSR